MGVSPPQTHITGISRLSTFIRCKSELHSPSRFGATTAQSTFPPGHVYHAPCLARSCCEVMTSQRYRDTGGVEFHLNYLWTKYCAPTGFSSRGRTGTKTHFDSRLHVDRAMFTNHTWHGVPCRSVSVSNLLWWFTRPFLPVRGWGLGTRTRLGISLCISKVFMKYLNTLI